MSGAVRQRVATRFDANERTAGYQRLFARWQGAQAPAAGQTRAFSMAAGWISRGYRTRAVPHDSVGLRPPMMVETAKRMGRPARHGCWRGVSGAAIPDTTLGKPPADHTVLPAASGSSAARRSIATTCNDSSPRIAIRITGRRARSADRLRTRNRFGRGVRRADSFDIAAEFSSDPSLRLRALRGRSSPARRTTVCCCPMRCLHFREADLALGAGAAGSCGRGRYHPRVGGGTDPADRRCAR